MTTTEWLARVELLKRGEFSVGRTHAWLTIAAPASAGRHGRLWLVRCRCGAERVVRESNMVKRTSPTLSCGCYIRQIDRPWTKTAALSHGHTSRGGAQKETAEYQCWQNMKKRCLDPSNGAYENYGGRGITVCDRWGSFENFIADMGARPPGFTIERRDNDKGYSPENCYWASRAVQSRNKRTTKIRPDEVDEIQKLRATGLGPTALANMFGVARTTIQRITNGRRTRSTTNGGG